MMNWLPKLGLSAIEQVVLQTQNFVPNKKQFVNVTRMPGENYPDYFSTLTNRRSYGGKTNKR